MNAGVLTFKLRGRGTGIAISCCTPPGFAFSIPGYGEESVSAGFEEIASDRWKDEVYRPDIKGRLHTLYKWPKSSASPGARNASNMDLRNASSD
ncbi:MULTISPECIES: hypothetical protein [Burkholderia]|uniref:hypothetical protein n=1 Tax=Burkholderia TaxID=32008 RepID=UPI001D10E8DC|nr:MULTISPECIES: hypothetical protein [Burkholderia]